MKTPPALSVSQMQTTFDEMVRDAIVLHPGIPSAILADQLTDEAEAEYSLPTAWRASENRLPGKP